MNDHSSAAADAAANTWPSLRVRSRLLCGVSLVFAAVVVSCSAWYAASPRTLPLDTLLSMATDALTALLLLANALFAFSARGYRIRHIALCGVLIATLAFTWCANGWRVDNRRQRFARQGKMAYEQAITNVLNNRQLLTDKESSVEQLVGDHPHATAWTNSDGSVTIVFPGLEGNYRMGYIYQSGGQLPSFIAVNPDTVHLTNGWYEY